MNACVAPWYFRLLGAAAISILSVFAPGAEAARQPVSKPKPDTAAITARVDQAVGDLNALRAHLDVAEVKRQLAELVAQARAQGVTGAEIASVLAQSKPLLADDERRFNGMIKGIVDSAKARLKQLNAPASAARRVDAAAKSARTFAAAAFAEIRAEIDRTIAAEMNRGRGPRR